jgi:hypothetical protein
MPTLPDTLDALVLRTDFSNDAVWDAIHATFSASLSFVSDRAFAGLTAEEVAALPRATSRWFLFLVDNVTVTDPEMPLVVVDLLHEPGRWFRAVPAEMWNIENNLAIANMDFRDFANHADPDGVFRGFPE